MFGIQDDAAKLLVVFAICASVFGSIAVVAMNFGPDNRSTVSEEKMVEILGGCEKLSMIAATCRNDVMKNLKVK